MQSLMQQHIEIYGRMLKSGNCCTIHFVETSSSLLYEAPYINTIVSNLCVCVHMYIYEHIDAYIHIFFLYRNLRQKKMQ